MIAVTGVALRPYARRTASWDGVPPQLPAAENHSTPAPRRGMIGSMFRHAFPAAPSAVADAPKAALAAAAIAAAAALIAAAAPLDGARS
ncbi:hypothetical protein ACFH04_38710 [Streptomyces noboritoensis]|uniref:Uncharacterized protein n=1 Tax=Streptomyces noboritoensis TaxID=67337 RepID=A0ABV6TUY9_9ACTN